MTTKDGVYQRPLMRYHGGKWAMAGWIVGHFPAHRVYVEPFGGAGSVLFHKPRSYGEVYNDLDEEVVNVFRVVRDPQLCRELTDALVLTPFSRVEFRAAYEKVEDPVERARRAIVRSFQGFGSASVSRDHQTGFRSNANRSGTNPAHDWSRYPACLKAWLERLRGVVIECRDAGEVIRQHDRPETLHYLDPPYVGSSRADPRWKRNYRFDLSDADHEQLAELLHGVKGYVVLSAYPCALYDELYKGWSRVETTACRDITQKRASERATECLWLSPRTAEASPAMQARLFR